ncbi:MAG: SPOR domain-containing protein [Deltaproteobacteria bacterium]|nr:SPOR domain-containing protein [Deltaproteobacteria bacterium]
MKNNSVLIDKKQVFLLFFSSVVIMILVFGAGVFLGRKLSAVAVSDEKPEKVISKSGIEDKPPLAITDTGLTDISEQVVAKPAEKTQEKSDTEAVKVAEQKTEPQKAKDEKRNVADTAEPKKKEEERKTEKPEKLKITTKTEATAESKKQEIADAKFTLQVGAFPDRSQALKTAAELEKKGYESWIQRAKSKDKDIFRVRIGKFATKQDAEKFKQQFDKKEKYNSFITPLE